ncbi:hypothetical protein THF1C08_270042 [Vibrio jasicida]|uniref:Uncharacterized protein n=1 Tax=Vibrio jasicida TaxID=766224 RepID=A0AAU9QP38_9VIBR|nr:hypothetical protein THF1C08_270042 [Vibrio jasicida]CAH1593109.1 hypothetical protein THF1A12_260042 [Vibrio jasicida]
MRRFCLSFADKKSNNLLFNQKNPPKKAKTTTAIIRPQTFLTIIILGHPFLPAKNHKFNKESQGK